MKAWFLALAIVAAAHVPVEADDEDLEEEKEEKEEQDAQALLALDDRGFEVYAQVAWAGWAYSSGEHRWNPTARAGFGRYRRSASSVRGAWAALEVSRLSYATASLNFMYVARRSGGGYAGVLLDTETGRPGLQLAGCISLESSREFRHKRGQGTTMRSCLELQLRDRPDGTAVAVMLSTSVDLLGLVAAVRDR